MALDKTQKTIIWVTIGLCTAAILILGSTNAANEGQAASGMFAALAIIALGCAAYFAPAILARDKPDFRSIFALNLFLGWTLVGWVIALVWALKNQTQIIVQMPAANPMPCPKCGKYSLVTAKFCDNCGQSFALNSPSPVSPVRIPSAPSGT